jgi:diaminobutyrate-2-oxoglutarate transaminase
VAGHDDAEVGVVSKAAGGIGMPIALILYSEKLDVWSPGAHTGTFRGNQLAFAAGVAAVDVMKHDRVLENVRSQGAYVMERLRDLHTRTPSIGEVRGRGLMIGIEVVEPRTGAPHEATAAAVQRRCLERGLIVERGGRQDAVVRLLPPLNVTRDAIDAALTSLSEAFSETRAVVGAQA